MASLNKIEGDAVEAVLLVVLVVLGLVIWSAYKGVSDIPQALQNLLRKLWNAVDSAFSASMNALQSPAFSGTWSGPPGNYDVVKTGTNMGADTADYSDGSDD